MQLCNWSLLKTREPITLKFFPIPEQSDQAINMEKSFSRRKENFTDSISADRMEIFLLIQLPQMKNIFWIVQEFR